MTWRLHVAKYKEWDLCTDPACPKEHVDYTPFRPVVPASEAMAQAWVSTWKGKKWGT
jgi:hypothetical protein